MMGLEVITRLAIASLCFLAAGWSTKHLYRSLLQHRPWKVIVGFEMGMMGFAYVGLTILAGVPL